MLGTLSERSRSGTYGGRNRCPTQFRERKMGGETGEREKDVRRFIQISRMQNSEGERSGNTKLEERATVRSMRKLTSRKRQMCFIKHEGESRRRQRETGVEKTGTRHKGKRDASADTEKRRRGQMGKYQGEEKDKKRR